MNTLGAGGPSSALRIQHSESSSRGCPKDLFLRVSAAAVRIKGLADGHGRVAGLPLLQAPPSQCSLASPLNPSGGMGRRGQGWQARRSCDDVLAHVLARRAEACPARGIHPAGVGPSHRLESGLGNSEQRWVAFPCEEHTIIRGFRCKKEVDVQQTTGATHVPSIHDWPLKIIVRLVTSRFIQSDFEVRGR